MLIIQLRIIVTTIAITAATVVVVVVVVVAAMKYDKNVSHCKKIGRGVKLHEN